MAVLAVYILLALVGARAGDPKQQGGPGAPPPTPTATPTPAATPTFKPAAAAAAATEPPPPQLTEPIPPPRMSESTRRTELPLYKYALLNSARMQGRGIVHGRTRDTKDPCNCGDKLYKDALLYQKLGAVERWCTEYPEDVVGLGLYDDDDDDDDEDYHLFSEDLDTIKCTETMPSILHPSSEDTQSSSRQTQPIVSPSSSRPVSSATCDPESLALQNFGRQSGIQSLEDIFAGEPSRLPSSSTEENRNQGRGNRSSREIQAAQSLVSMLTSQVELHTVNVQGGAETVPMDESDIPDESMEVDDGDGRSGETCMDVDSLGSNITEQRACDSVADEYDDYDDYDDLDECEDSDEYDEYVESDSGSIPEDIEAVEDSTEPNDMEVIGKSNIADMAAEGAVDLSTKRKEEVISQKLHGATTLGHGSSLQPPAATPEPRPGPSGLCRPPLQEPQPGPSGLWRRPLPEPQPGPSAVWRPPSPGKPNISFPDYPETRYSRNRESVIYSADGYPGSETYGPFSKLDWHPPPPEDLNKELNRIFGVQKDNRESSLEEPEPIYCLGEMKVSMLGTNVRPLYMVYVKCYAEPNICPPPTVCTSIINSVIVSRRKDIPIDQQTFRLMGDPKDEWEPATIQASSGCFCASPEYIQRIINASR